MAPDAVSLYPGYFYFFIRIAVTPVQAGIQQHPIRHTRAGGNPVWSRMPFHSIRATSVFSSESLLLPRRRESSSIQFVIPAQAGIQQHPIRHSRAGGNPGCAGIRLDLSRQCHQAATCWASVCSVRLCRTILRSCGAVLRCSSISRACCCSSRVTSPTG